MLDRTVIGVFDHFENARLVISDLYSAGFDRAAIGLMTSDEQWKLAELDAQEKPPVTGSHHPIEHDELTNRVGTGAAIGGVSGLLLGLISLVIPGIGPILAAGPIVAALTGGTIGAAAGGLVGAFSSAGASEEHANFYANALRRGATIVTVNTSVEDADIALTIMRNRDAIDIDRRADQYRLQAEPPGLPLS